jgi:hypothetical protein
MPDSIMILNNGAAAYKPSGVHRDINIPLTGGPMDKLTFITNT